MRQMDGFFWKKISGGILIAWLFMSVILLAGCISKDEDGKKLRNLDFTVVKESEIPEEMMEMIEEQKIHAFQGAYEDQGYLYIVEGYGMQETTGYSIEVENVYETEYDIKVETRLLGPPEGEKTVETKTFPYVVIKLEAIDKNVQWR